MLPQPQQSGKTLQSQGRYSEAEPLYVQALELKERVLGVNHPSTITTRENLAILRQERSLPSPGD
jgi:hypothetical protein